MAAFKLAAEFSYDELLEVGALMMKHVDVKDRCHRLRTHKMCFVGQEAVAWMVHVQLVANPAQAVALGNRLMDAGLFHHVLHEHHFRNEALLYRFRCHQEELAQIKLASKGVCLLNAESGGMDSSAGLPTLDPACSGAKSRAVSVLAGQVSHLQSRVAKAFNDLAVHHEVSSILVDETSATRTQLQELLVRVSALEAAAAAANASGPSPSLARSLFSPRVGVTTPLSRQQAQQQQQVLLPLLLPLAVCCLLCLVSAVAAATNAGLLLSSSAAVLCGSALLHILFSTGGSTGSTGGAGITGGTDCTTTAAPLDGSLPACTGFPSLVQMLAQGTSFAFAKRPSGSSSVVAQTIAADHLTSAAPSTSLFAAFGQQGASPEATGGTALSSSLLGPLSRLRLSRPPDLSLRHSDSSGGSDVDSPSALLSPSLDCPTQQAAAAALASAAKASKPLASSSSRAARAVSAAMSDGVICKADSRQDSRQDSGRDSKPDGPEQRNRSLPPPLASEPCLAAALTRSRFVGWPDTPVMMLSNPAAPDQVILYPGGDQPKSAAVQRAHARRTSDVSASPTDLPVALSSSVNSISGRVSSSGLPRASPDASIASRGSTGGGKSGGGTGGTPSLASKTPHGGGTPNGGVLPPVVPVLPTAPPALRLNCVARPVEFETDLFKGKLWVFLRGLDNTPPGLFDGKKRMSWVGVQGKFKSRLRLDDVVTGQEFARPFQYLPAPWFVERVLLTMARQISPSMQVGPLSKPSLLVPIVASAQVINVSKEGTEPDCLDATDDMRLFCRSLQGSNGQPWSSTRRRSHFSSAKHRANQTFDTENVYTLLFWQQFVDIGNYCLDFGVRYDLFRHLDGQALQVMTKDLASGKYLYNTEVWHLRHAVADNAANSKSDGGGDDALTTPESSRASSQRASPDRRRT